MRSLVLLSLLSCTLAFAGCTSQTSTNTANSNAAPARPAGVREPVLVELFTSEGCPNCPNADAELAFLDSSQPVPGAEVITLGYHVDYFDQRGWKDPYSSHAFTDRQNQYSKIWNLQSIYTPQMIVDGQKQFVGSDVRQANEVIAKAAITEKPEVEVGVNDKRIEINVQNIAKHDAATVFLAAAEDNIATNVTAGSNNGRTLHHASVVRGLAPIAKLTSTQSGMKTSVDVKPDPKWKGKYAICRIRSGR